MGYEDFRKELTHKVEERLEWKELATFMPNKPLPVYNWFYFKEGFSKQLVDILIDMFKLNQGDTVLDSFCGSGTTLLACKQKSINSVGLDVLPTAVFASRVKTADYDVEKLRGEAKLLFRPKFRKLQRDFPKIMRAMINKYALEDIAFFSSIINDLENKDFFTLALMNSSIKVSYAWKDGGVIKIKRHPTPPLRKLFQRTVYRMIKDVGDQEKTNAANHMTQSRKMHSVRHAVLRPSTLVLQQDARTVSLQDDSVDAVITSPPYLNNIDYTKLYAIEDFFMKMRHVPSIRSFLGVRGDTDQKEAYFEDMKKMLEELYRVCKPSAHVAIVIGNAWLGEEIESDFITSYLAEEIGFGVEKIFILNKRFALEQRTIKKGLLRESLIIMKKN